MKKYRLAFLSGLLAIVTVSGLLLRSPSQATSSRKTGPAEVTSQTVAHERNEKRVDAWVQARRFSAASGPAPESLTKAYPELKQKPEWAGYFRGTDKITVAPYPDLPLTFQLRTVKVEDKYVTWFGTVPEIPGSSLIAVATPGGAETAVLIMPGSSQFTFHTSPDGVTTVQESQPGEEGCAVGWVTPNRNTAQTPITSAIYKAQYTAAARNFGSNTDTALGGPAQADSTTLYVGVLFLYQQATLDLLRATQSDPAAYIDGYSKACIESGNVVLNNSAVTNFQWRYLGAALAPAYTRTANVNLDFDLSAISLGGAIGDWVISKANAYGAAQVIMWNSGDEPGVTASGVANVSPQAPVGSANSARAVVLWTSAASPVSYKTVIHELSHNFGCMHDRLNANATTGGTTGAADGDGRYCYGQLWRNNPVSTTYNLPTGTTRTDYPNGNITFTRPDGTKVYSWSRDVGYGVTVIGSPVADGSFSVTNTYYDTSSTLMGYGGAIIPYFSNPNINIHVTAVLAGQLGSGDWGVVPLGFPVTDPKAAYNAKVMTDSAPAMAGYGSGISTPAIITQPQGAMVASGSTLSLGVVATGGGLSYQWLKGGVAISGATASGFTKTADTSDNGDYTVTVTNSAGSVTSTKATVTVSVAVLIPTTPTAGGSSGGGGGGGAPSLWFFGSVAILTVVRTLFRPRK